MSGVSKWRIALLQGLAVLSGILAAFAIDAAWDLRRERETASAYIESLRVELDENEGTLAAHLDELQRAIEVAEQFMVDVAASRTAAVSQDSIRGMLWAMRPLEVLPLRRAAFDDLTSGGLQVVEQPEIRRAVLAYGQALEFARLRQEQASTWDMMRWTPYIEMEGDLVGMASTYGGGWLNRTDLSYDFDVGAYAGNRRFGNLLALRAYRLRWVRDSLQRLLDLLLELQELMDTR